MPILTINSVKAYLLYDFTGFPSSWEAETENTRLATIKLLDNTLICDNKLYKLVNGAYLSYIRLSQRLSVIPQIHRDI